MTMTHAQARAQLSSPGAPFELDEVLVAGVPTRVWKHGPGTLVDIFVPWPLTDKTKPQGNTMTIVGRLKAGATVPSAQTEFNVLGKQLTSQYPERNPLAPRLVPLAQRVSGAVRPALFVLACAVGVVMVPLGQAVLLWPGVTGGGPAIWSEPFDLASSCGGDRGRRLAHVRT